MTKTNILLLNEEELIQCGVIDFAHCVDVLEEMFKLLGAGDYVMGGEKHNSHGIPIIFPKESPFPNMPLDGPDRRFMAMPAYLGGRFNVAGMKWYGSNIVNPQRGLPRSVLLVILNDPDTCEPIAIMSGNLISAARTGSVPGVAVRYLANPDSEVCTCIGAGPISRSCFQGIYSQAKGLKKLVVYDLFKEKSEAFCKWAKEEFGIEGYAADSMEEAIRMGDIISVAASSLKPVELCDEWLKPGSTLLLTGRCYVDESYYKNARIVFDNPLEHDVNYDEQLLLPEGKRFTAGIGVDVYRMSYEGKLPPIAEMPGLGNAVNGMKIRQNHDDRICFITFGMPTEDVAWGYEMYVTAKAKGLGTTFPLWPKEPLYK
jgi:ornithine cyclodeaminase/alanine dehydrogenase-like protein (mu-crystallin family)